MATLNRAPFWAPRPADDTYWQGAPIPTGAIRLTTTQVKFFGQPGQAPTKRWLPYLTYDDPPMWQGSPLNSQAITVTRTQVKIYGQPGQAPTKYWLPYLTYDDSAYWSGAPLKSPIIPFLTQQKIFGAGGQVPPFRPNFTYDDASYWSGTPLDAAPIPLLTAVKVFGQGGQVPPFRWNATYDDASYWSGKPLSSAAIAILTPQQIFGQGGQVPPFRPNFTYDDASYWSGSPIKAAPIQLLTPQKIFGQGGQVPPFRWNYTYDDASFWQGSPTDAAPIQLLTAQKVFGQGGQVPPYRWNYTLDDPGFWAGTPVSSAAIPLLTQPKLFGQGGQAPPFRPNFTLDDPPSWSPTVERNLSLLFPTHNPFSNLQWQWSDDASGWQGSPLSSGAITVTRIQASIYGQPGQVPPFRPNFTYDDASPWQWPLYERNPNVLVPSSEPFNNYKTYWYSEESFWQGSPLSSGAIVATRTQQSLFGQPGEVPPFRPNFTIDDPPSWQWPLYERNPNVLLPLSQPFNNRQWQWSGYDDAAFWQGSPIWSATTTLAGFVLYAPRSNWSIWTLRLELDSFWQGSPLSSGVVGVTGTQVKIYGQPGQAPPFRPNFTLDDPPMWPGPVPRGSAAIQLPATGNPFNLYGPFNLAYTFDDAPQWQGTPFSPNYLLTKPGPPIVISGTDWIDFRRRARRR